MSVHTAFFRIKDAAKIRADNALCQGTSMSAWFDAVNHTPDLIMDEAHMAPNYSVEWVITRHAVEEP